MSKQNKPHKHAEVIKAWADGAMIQIKDSEDKWHDVPSNAPSWGTYFEYRIKPEPKPDLTRTVKFTMLENYVAMFEWCGSDDNNANLRIIFDGETLKLKSVEVL